MNKYIVFYAIIVKWQQNEVILNDKMYTHL